MPLLILLALFVAEITVLIAVGAWLGIGWTVLLFVATSVLGTVLARSQGRRTVAALRQAQRRSDTGAHELAAGAIGGVGALLLVIPGFITDVLGLLLLLTPVQALLRPVLVAALTRRVLVVPGRFGRGGGRDPDGGAVIEGEVVSTEDRGPSRTPLPGPGQRPHRS